MMPEELFTRIGWALIHSLWQGTLVTLAAAALLLFIRGAAARHLLGMATMTLILVLVILKISRPPVAQSSPRQAPPVLQTPPAQSPPEPETPSSSPGPPQTVTNDWAHQVLPSRPPAEETTLPQSAEVSDAITPLPWVTAAWLLGVLILSIRHLGGWLCLRRWRTRNVVPATSGMSREVSKLAQQMGIFRKIPLLISERISVPVVVGLVKPTILLPASLIAGLPPADLEALLAHELAHIRRRDSWAHHFQLLIETLLFYHPAIWILARFTRREREKAADDLVLKIGLDQKVYAGALASIAEQSAHGSLSLAANDGALSARIRRILLPRKTHQTSPAAGWIGALALTTTTLAFHLATPRSLADEETQSATPDFSETIQVREGESIQAAIEKARPNALIKIGAGQFPEELFLKKAVTLQGAGWDQTILIPEVQPRKEGSATLTFIGARGATLKDLQVTIQGTDKIERSNHLLAKVSDSRIQFETCAFIGPADGGIWIQEGSRVSMDDSIVAAVWGTGITVEGQGDHKASELHFRNGIVRSCHYAGITLGPGCHSSLVTNSRISGSAWHGIRYNSASPLIENNLISGNARSGIYASGKTKARVSGNVFAENEMDGLSCWFQNEDHVTGNRFLNNHREAIAVIGSAKPRIEENEFLQKKGTVLKCGSTQKDPVNGSPTLKDNLANAGIPLVQIGTQKMDSIEGMTISAEQISSVIPTEIGPGKKAWQTLLPAEQKIVPDEKSRSSRLWKKPGKEAERSRAQAIKPAPEGPQLVADAFQLDDTGKRDRAFAKMAEMIRSNDPQTQLTGLTAFNQTGQVRFERKEFPGLVRPLLKSKEAAVRTQAIVALKLAGLETGDLDRIAALTGDPAPPVKIAAGQTLVAALQNDLTHSEHSPKIAALLRDPETRKELLHALWGVKLSPEVEAEVLKLSHTTKVSEANTNDIAYTALYYALSTQANKSEASVKRLVEYLAAQDTHNIAGRAAWGLGQGVAPAQQDLVVKGALQFMEARTPQSYAFRQCLARVKQYAAKGDKAAIETFLQKPALGDELKAELEGLLKQLK